MSIITSVNEKKKALLAYKEKLLEEINDCQKKIQEIRAKPKTNIDYDEDSSDSEDDVMSKIDIGPSMVDLKEQQSMLRTCLQATQELTNLTVLQSEINVLVEEPKLDREPPVSGESGTWKEVTVECRVDLVPFSVTFFTHTPHRKFASTSYRGLRIVLIKASHDNELNRSILHSLTRPSDAVEVIRSFAEAHRSRRTTLAKLAKEYPTCLFMEPHAEGGYVLKCANLLELWWRLENKWSPIAPFHHRMKFDLEYMDESYIKLIKQFHKQLLNPSLQTDERTLLLSKIISTCLKASGEVEPQEGAESDSVASYSDFKNDLKLKEREMAPPKSLPKKSKAKNKENNAPNVAQKRSINSDNNSAKKMKSGGGDVKDKEDLCETGNTFLAAPIIKAVTHSNKVDKIKKSNALTEDMVAAPISQVNENIDGVGNNVKKGKVSKNVANSTGSKKTPKVVEGSANINKVDTKTVPLSKNSKDQDENKIHEKNNNDECKPKNKAANPKSKNVASMKTSKNENKNKIITKSSNNDNAGVSNIPVNTKTKNDVTKVTMMNFTEVNKLPETHHLNEKVNPTNKIDRDQVKLKKIISTKNFHSTDDISKECTKNEAITRNENTNDKHKNKTVAKSKGASSVKSNNVINTNTENKIDANNKVKNMAENSNAKKINEKLNVNIKKLTVKTKQGVKNNKAFNSAVNEISDKNIEYTNIFKFKPKNNIINSNTHEITNSVKFTEGMTKSSRQGVANSIKLSNNLAETNTKVAANNAKATNNAAKRNAQETANKPQETTVSVKSADNMIRKNNKDLKQDKPKTMKMAMQKNAALKLKDKVSARSMDEINQDKHKKLGKLANDGVIKNLNRLKAGNTLRAGIFEKENSAKVSKIPQKLSPSSFTKNPLRMSPRSLSTKTQLSSKHVAPKSTTSIPRLKRPTPK